jgi:uncharacterized protein with FMN-binding domain
MGNLIDEAVQDGTDNNELESDAKQAVIDATQTTQVDVINEVNNISNKVIQDVTEATPCATE